MPRVRSAEGLAAPIISDLSARIERKLTVPEQVAEALRELILKGDLAPGASVIESQLSRQLRVGQPTVREALKMLESEGLIERQPNRGCTVMKLDRDDLDQIAVLRQNWEPLAIALALASWSDEKAERLKQAFALMEKAGDTGDVLGYFKHDMEFHRTIWSLSGNRYLERALNQIVLPSFAFFVMHFHRHRSFTFADNVAEHREIVDAMLARDLDRVQRVMSVGFANFLRRARDLMASPAAVPEAPKR